MSKKEDLEQYAMEFYRELVTTQEDLDLQEVMQALFMIGLDKSHCLDGFTAGFYQTHWELISDSVTRAVL